MEIKGPFGPGGGYQFEPSKQSNELQAIVQQWLDDLKNRGHITPTHHEELSKELTLHPDKKSIERLANELFSHLPSNAPKPPINGNGNGNGTH